MRVAAMMWVHVDNHLVKRVMEIEEKECLMMLRMMHCLSFCGSLKEYGNVLMTLMVEV